MLNAFHKFHTPSKNCQTLLPAKPYQPSAVFQRISHLKCSARFIFKFLPPNDCRTTLPTVEQSLEELTALTERALLAKCSGDRVAPPAPQTGFISAVTSGVDEFLSSTDEDGNAKRRRGV